MYFDAGDLFLSPEEYQRESAWGKPQKQLLIDTIFRGMDIPKFYLWKIDDSTLVNGYPDGETKQIRRAKYYMSCARIYRSLGMSCLSYYAVLYGRRLHHRILLRGRTLSHCIQVGSVPRLADRE